MRLTKLNELIEDGKALKGRWEIGKNHEIQFRSFEKDDEIRVRGTLMAAEPGALVIAVTEKQSDQRLVTSLWKLSGLWKTSPKNQLIFEAERQSGRKEALTFTGGWRVGEFQELLYTYEVQDLKTRRKEIKLLVFHGVWNIDSKNALTYLLGGGSGSSFRFRGTFQTKNILAKKGEIRYQAGMEISGKRQAQDIVLFGKWKYSDRLGLSFEMEYEAGKKASIAFAGDYALTERRTVSVELKTRTGIPLGVEILLTQDIFGRDGQAFVRLKKSMEESRIEAGFRTKF